MMMVGFISNYFKLNSNGDAWQMLNVFSELKPSIYNLAMVKTWTT